MTQSPLVQAAPEFDQWATLSMPTFFMTCKGKCFFVSMKLHVRWYLSRTLWLHP